MEMIRISTIMMYINLKHSSLVDELLNAFVFLFVVGNVIVSILHVRAMLEYVKGSFRSNNLFEEKDECSSQC